MKFETYTAEREVLMNALQTLVEEGASQEVFDAKKAEVEVLDNKFEEAKLRMANLNSLKEQTVVDLNTIVTPITNVEGGQQQMNLLNPTQATNVLSKEKVMENAFYKTLANQPLTQEEMQNVHTTENGAVLIPQHTADAIIGLVSEQFPFFGDSRKHFYKGILVLPKHKAITSGDANFYEEDTPTATEENEFTSIVFGAKEVAKLVEVTFKLEAMSIDSFMSYITTELAKRIGRAVGTSVYTGTNTQTSFSGLITTLNAQANKPQVVDYASGSDITYKHLTQAMGKISSEFHAGVAIYANSNTVWNQLANITAEDGRPLFITDVVSGGVARLFGKVVKVDAGVPDGVVVISNAFEGYGVNEQSPLNIKTQEDLRSRKTLISGLTILDGQVTREDASAIIAPTA